MITQERRGGAPPPPPQPYAGRRVKTRVPPRDAPPHGGKARKIPPLVWIVLALLVLFAVIAVAQCDGARYTDAAPLKLSFNTDDAWTLGPAVDWNKPGELLVTGSAKAPRAGKLDIYRMKAPAATGKPGCV